ncbi:tegument protein [Equid alphaherpesvirus 1]|uniref:Envelope protein US9 homolog n=3 Tax=Equid alphaherpesvirus 1 TaxID=10326 RepID=US9_EHV1B|nr:membrane protein US9 [Equid alphaherpesvirus 1]P28930.1 RecName: Full=Envelope protein US9 homolog; AltName: Full=Envelope protein 76; AltName: Full=ORF76 protein [Equine herpesvirus type 1 (strain AB4P)]AAT67333.1 tegument protein [Equid alphaherpesvirus 1]AMB15555.1 tegument protein [Equid alphaherpesvirus 1]APQ36578.1 tegument protein EUS9 [Equid alphaherpesvirus 1]APQ36728.1 tegument protein EUS9 [Equid alphaherpesvirus 1]APQ36803.1 tegument protein EUS9 [Equid alphaherpesvirus 1]
MEKAEAAAVVIPLSVSNPSYRGSGMSDQEVSEEQSAGDAWVSAAMAAAEAVAAAATSTGIDNTNDYTYTAASENGDPGFTLGDNTYGPNGAASGCPSPPSPEVVGLEMVVVSSLAPEIAAAVPADTIFASAAAPATRVDDGNAPLLGPGQAQDYDSESGCYYSESDNETASMFIRRVGRRQARRHRRRRVALTVAGVILVVVLCAISGIVGAFLARVFP